ncbi:D-alanyl-D-alanine carboxypeptidase [Halobacteriovorax sp. HLS]|uniref:D-alanyl-D-alanine carboxypeptidase n=1 Tax=Halobacteriovorax sp. HLS TaxID=2234000 RepID=UPI000FDA1430|nr:D-alanyl-D-alanine carboxypeptidase [Halobacteriovorax sp. HLS]
MNRLLALAPLTCLLLSANSQAKTDWEKILDNYNMSPQYHSFCHTNETGEVEGSNPHMKVRLASISKLITTYWAMEKLTPEYQYESQFFLKDKHLHIVGDKDPIYSKRKLFFLLSQLNNLGITELDKITFDKNLRVYTNAEGYIGDTLVVTKSRTAANLKDYFHTPDWNKLKLAYANFIKETPQEIIKALEIRESLEDLNLSVKEVSFSEKNPFENDPAAKQSIHLSPKIVKYLKAMNIKSNNYIADEVFDKLGGEKEFDKFIGEKVENWYPNIDIDRTNFDKGSKSIKIFSGSGLPSYKNGQRNDNYATCSIVVKIIEDLNQVMTEYQKSFQQVVAVAGSDIDSSGATKSTIRKRFLSPKLKNVIMAKTGTLFHTSALAGKLSTKSGDKYFGVFHQMRGWKGHAKAAQDEIVQKIIDNSGGGEKVDYNKEFFFPAYEVMR